MFSVNISGVFMTAQAVSRHMVRFKKGGSIVLIGSMSTYVANKVQSSSSPLSSPIWTAVN
jgi:NAD(P)-dependent dehydrogenase (short-subunit alcohol dehydrogenase family)